MMDLKYFGGCATQQTEYEPDGSEGTVTVEWFNGKESPVITVGCVVKNDKTFRDLTDNQITEETKYFAYTCGIPLENSKAEIRVHRFKKPENKKKCTVDDRVNKKVVLDKHEYIFVPCEDSTFNRSSFLKEYSISIKSSTLSPCEVCKDGRVMGLCKEQTEGPFKFFKFEINRQESTSDRFYIEDNVFHKLEETGPLLIGRGKSKTLVGYYRKSPSGNHITISTLTTKTETIDVCLHSHCATLHEASQVHQDQPDTISQEQNYTNKLKKSIKKRTDFHPRMINGKKIRTDDIFTTLTIQRGQKRFKKNQAERFDRKQFDEVKASITSLKNCSEMFICPENDDPKSTATGNPKSILLIGKAGIGKTLFCQKLMRDWANDILFEKEENSKAPIFEFALLLTFSQLSLMGQKELGLLDILKCSSLLNEQSIIDEALLQYIIENPEKLLLIIDGYDEYNHRDKITSNFEMEYPNDPSEKIPVPAMIAKLLKGKILQDSVVLISSRPGEAEALAKITFDVTVEITGFSPPQVMKYVENYFQENESLKYAVLNHIKAKDFLVSFGEIPVMCFLMCYYMEWHVSESRTATTIPATRTDLYHEVIKIFIKKHHGESKYTEMRETEIQETLLKLAELSFNLTKGEKIIFKEEDMKKLNFSEREITSLKASGLLDCCPGVKTSPFDEPALDFVFTHQTIQEYLCALWCVETKQIPDEEEETSGVTLIFMAGLLSRKKDENFMKKLLERSQPRNTNDNTNKLLVLNVLYEYGDEELSKLIIDDMYEQFCNRDGWIVFSHVTYVDCFYISYLVDLIKLTNTYLTSNHSLNTLYIGFSSLSSSGIQVLFESIVNNSFLTRLILCDCNLDDKCVEIIANNLLSTKITDLQLWHNDITDNGVESIRDVLIKDSCWVKQLNLRHNDKITSECKESLRNLVRKRKPQVKLILDYSDW